MLSKQEKRYLEAVTEDLQETKNTILHFVDLYLQYQATGDVKTCEMVEQSLSEAHEFLVREFGVKTQAEVDALLSNLKNGNVQALPNCGVLLEKNPTDHLESILTAFDRP